MNKPEDHGMSSSTVTVRPTTWRAVRGWTTHRSSTGRGQSTLYGNLDGAGMVRRASPLGRDTVFTLSDGR